MADTLYVADYRGEDAALHAADLLIAALYALNATDMGMGKRSESPIGMLAFQEPGSAFQLTSDALKATLRALTADVDPDGAHIDEAMSVMLDVMGESTPARTIRNHVRDLVAAETPGHIDYPHAPGRLIDCPACEAKCHCTGVPGDEPCVYVYCQPESQD